MCADLEHGSSVANRSGAPSRESKVVPCPCVHTRGASNRARCESFTGTTPVSRPLRCTPAAPVAQTGLSILESRDGDLEVLYCPPRGPNATEVLHGALCFLAWAIAAVVLQSGWYILVSRMTAEAEEFCEEAVWSVPEGLCFHQAIRLHRRSIFEGPSPRMVSYTNGAAPAVGVSSMTRVR